MFTTSKGIRMYVPSAQDAHQDEWYYLFRDEEHGEEFFVRARAAMKRLWLLPRITLTV